MQAGRELDAKVAEALGWRERIGGWVKFSDRGPAFIEEKHFRPSTTWEGMGVLVEQARKQGISLEFSHALNGGYYGGAYTFVDGEYQIDHSTKQALTSAPHAVCLAFLMAQGIAV